MMYSQKFDLMESGNRVSRLVIGVPTRGCRWWLGGAGCVHCSVGSVLSLHAAVRSPLEHVERELRHWEGHSFKSICIYTPGSALDGVEIDTGELGEIVAAIRELSGPKKITLESRPELVSDEVLASIRCRAQKTTVEIVVPLESSNVDTRKVIGKHFTNDDFIGAARRIKQSGCTFSTTILIKPPGLSEAEAIHDGRESLSWLRMLEPARVVVEPMAVYDDTALANLYRDGLYHPPWLWSVHAVMISTADMNVEMGGEFYYPSPIALSRNCPRCSVVMEVALREMGTGNRNIRLPSCPCREQWLDQVQHSFSNSSTSSAACANPGQRQWAAPCVHG